MHRLHLRLASLALLAVAVFPLGGCLFRTRHVDRQLSNVPLKTASQADLIRYINAQATAIRSLQATVDINASVGDEKNSQVTDYSEIRGYVLLRKPAMLRLKGLMPLVRNTAFDMVSDGEQFRLWIPTKNKFVMGANNFESLQPQHKLENLRPQHIYDALLLPEIGADGIAVLENGYETVLDARRHRVEQPDYQLAVIQRGPNGWYLSRKIEFSRSDLRPHQQQIFDLQGNVVTEVRYRDYKDYGGIEFPSGIEIDRPREGYDIALSIVKLELNRALTDEQFALEQPPGAEVVHMDQANSHETKGSDGPEH